MRDKRNQALSGRLAVIGKLCLFFLFVITFTGCSQAAAPTSAPQASPTMEAALPTATLEPLPTATQPPTATPEPTATPTQPPTAPTVPELAVLADGFNAWCAPEEYAGTRPSGPDAPDYARLMVAKDKRILVPIPATYCTLIYHFNQTVPEGTTLTFFDGKHAFLKLPLQAADGRQDEAWTPVTHSYVINPPLWYVDYTLSVTAPDGKELWSNPVRFAKPLPKPCQFGGYPDPVTMWCTPTDPWEIEPWPDVEYPYPRNP